ncbi:hypothetical protein [Pontibacter sp. G13]|uniref:hypothetical protein n=1 Tax=Pontibacter sp. G13 TaxID=3074898 RepID=UPI00288C41D5|nr:hypothetical protein [Pontibacter sp. G13]WNJ20658.1 hypothetical protein RJD25_09260 [Pontibacter sp. G13]
MRDWNTIETFIRDHREEIDRDTPSANLWDRIEQELHPGDVRQVQWYQKSIIWQAAAVILIMVTVGVWYYSGNPGMEGPMTADFTSIKIETQFAEWEEIRMNYSKEIDALQSQVNGYDLAQYDFSEDYREDLNSVNEELDRLYQDLKEDGYSEDLAAAMIKTCEQKKVILEQFLARINQSQSKQPL